MPPMHTYIHVHTPSQPKPAPPPHHLPKTHPDSPQLQPTATRPSSVSVHGRRHVGLLTLGNHGDGGADAESPFSVGRASVGRSPRDDVTECGLLGQTEREGNRERRKREPKERNRVHSGLWYIRLSVTLYITGPGSLIQSEHPVYTALCLYYRCSPMGNWLLLSLEKLALFYFTGVFLAIFVSRAVLFLVCVLYMYTCR